MPLFCLHTNKQSKDCEPFCIKNVNSTLVFEHFEDLKNLIIFNILKEIISCFVGSFTLKLYKVF